MLYRDINANRLQTVLYTFASASLLLSEQGCLGVLNGGCCNRQHRDPADPNKGEIGCIVGLMVGIEHFEVGSNTTVRNLNSEDLKKAYNRSADIYNLPDWESWENLDPKDRGNFREILNCLQRLHDNSPAWGFKSIDLICAICSAYAEWARGILDRVDVGDCTVTGCQFNIDLGIELYRASPNMIMEDLNRSIFNFILKK
jgi:hypothetical protein